MRYLILLLLPLHTLGQSTDKPFHELGRFLEGDWNSHAEDCIGLGEGTRSCAWILDSTCLHIRNYSETPSPDGSPPSIHRDWTFLTYDAINDLLVLREFHNESYVNRYAADSISADRRVFVFNSTDLQNVPSGWRARVTIRITGSDRFVETFELASPGQALKPYVVGSWRRTTD